MTLTILIDAVRRFRHQNLIHSWQDSAIDEVEKRWTHSLHNLAAKIRCNFNLPPTLGACAL